MTELSKDDLCLCMGCMNKIAEDAVCPYCGYDNRKPADLGDGRLAPQTVLQSRYIVGKLRYKNPDSYVYLAYDCVLQTAVTIREYMPAKLCRRDKGGLQLIPNQDSAAQYKALLSDFYDLAKSIEGLKNVDGIIPTLNLFQENGTVYVVYKRIKTLKMGTFVQKTNGKLQWSIMREIFLQMCSTISHLHDAGIIHRGISMETARIDEDGILWLTDFCIPSARTLHSELDAKLYPGYSAPEQYSVNTWQGTWTDVYSAAAVIYTTLTDVVPQDAMERKRDDKLFYADQIAKNIPANVSVALYNALRLSVDERTRTIENFTAELLKAVTDDTVLYDTAVLEKQKQLEQEKVENQQPVVKEKKQTLKKTPKPVKKKTKEKRKKPKKERNIPYVIVSLAIICLVVIGITIYFLLELFSVLNQPPKKRPVEPYSQASTVAVENTDVIVDGIEVPNLIGEWGEDVQRQYGNHANYVLSIQEEYSNEYSEGYVFRQSPEPGTVIEKGEALVVWVSLGHTRATMPEVTGLSLSEAQQRLLAKGFPFEVVELDDYSLPKDVVVRTNIKEGSSVESGTNVILYIRAENAVEPLEDPIASIEEEEPDRDTSSSAEKKYVFDVERFINK